MERDEEWKGESRRMSSLPSIFDIHITSDVVYLVILHLSFLEFRPTF